MEHIFYRLLGVGVQPGQCHRSSEGYCIFKTDSGSPDLLHSVLMEAVLLDGCLNPLQLKVHLVALKQGWWLTIPSLKVFEDCVKKATSLRQSRTCTR